MKPVSFCMLIKHIHDESERYTNNALREQDMTMAQSGVLYALSNTDQSELSFKELEHQLQVAQSSTVRMIERLEQKQLLETSTSEEDRRVKLARITDRGRECYAQTSQQVTLTEERVLSCLTAEEREQLLEMLTRISNHIMKF